MGKAKTAIIIVVLAALIGGYYFYLSNKTETPKEIKVSAVQDVILRDLDKNYPPTPKEVVKYYSELSKCLYNEKYSTEEFEQMADKMLALYDDELLEANPRDQYLMDLNSAISDFRKQDYSIPEHRRRRVCCKRQGVCQIILYLYHQKRSKLLHFS